MGIQLALVRRSKIAFKARGRALSFLWHGVFLLSTRHTQRVGVTVQLHDSHDRAQVLSRY